MELINKKYHRPIEVGIAIFLVLMSGVAAWVIYADISFRVRLMAQFDDLNHISWIKVLSHWHLSIICGVLLLVAATLLFNRHKTAWYFAVLIIVFELILTLSVFFSGKLSSFSISLLFGAIVFLFSVSLILLLLLAKEKRYSVKTTGIIVTLIALSVLIVDRFWR